MMCCGSEWIIKHVPKKVITFQSISHIRDNINRETFIQQSSFEMLICNEGSTEFELGCLCNVIVALLLLLSITDNSLIALLAIAVAFN